MLNGYFRPSLLSAAWLLIAALSGCAVPRCEALPEDGECTYLSIQELFPARLPRSLSQSLSFTVTGDAALAHLLTAEAPLVVKLLQENKPPVELPLVAQQGGRVRVLVDAQKAIMLDGPMATLQVDIAGRQATRQIPLFTPVRFRYIMLEQMDLTSYQVQILPTLSQQPIPEYYNFAIERSDGTMFGTNIRYYRMGIDPENLNKATLVPRPLPVDGTLSGLDSRCSFVVNDGDQVLSSCGGTQPNGSEIIKIGHFKAGHPEEPEEASTAYPCDAFIASDPRSPLFAVVSNGVDDPKITIISSRQWPSRFALLNVPLSTTLKHVVFADLTGDQRADLVNIDNDFVATVWLREQENQFVLAEALSAEITAQLAPLKKQMLSAMGLAIADLDQDGLPDLVLTTASAGGKGWDLYLLPYLGSGHFAGYQRIPLPDGSADIKQLAQDGLLAEDVNQDGRIDLVLSESLVPPMPAGPGCAKPQLRQRIFTLLNTAGCLVEGASCSR